MGRNKRGIVFYKFLEVSPESLSFIRRGYRRPAEVRLESFHNCVVAFSRRKCEGQATVNALQKTAALRHQDTDPMCRETGTVGWDCLFQICSGLRMRRRRPRLILHNGKSLFAAKLWKTIAAQLKIELLSKESTGEGVHSGFDT